MVPIRLTERKTLPQVVKFSMHLRQRTDFNIFIDAKTEYDKTLKLG